MPATRRSKGGAICLLLAAKATSRTAEPLLRGCCSCEIGCTANLHRIIAGHACASGGCHTRQLHRNCRIQRSPSCGHSVSCVTVSALPTITTAVPQPCKTCGGGDLQPMLVTSIVIHWWCPKCGGLSGSLTSHDAPTKTRISEN